MSFADGAHDAHDARGLGADRRRGRTSAGRDRAPTGPARGHGVVPSLVVGLLAGVAVWLAWLGWDRSPSRDVVTGTVADPYVTLQVLGCALTGAVVVAVLAARHQPVVAPAAAAPGFWVAWSADAFTQDDSGLLAVGSALLLVGLVAAVPLAAVTGWALGRRQRARRR